MGVQNRGKSVHLVEIYLHVDPTIRFNGSFGHTNIESIWIRCHNLELSIATVWVKYS